MQETRVQSLGKEDPLEKGMATHFSFLAWKILVTEGLQGVGHDGATGAFTHILHLMLVWELLCES